MLTPFYILNRMGKASNVTSLPHQKTPPLIPCMFTSQ
jgi:hypothetical protein